MKKIRFCPNCKLYTMKEFCPKCGKETIIKEPPPYNPNDKYKEYWIKERIKLLKSEGDS